MLRTIFCYLSRQFFPVLSVPFTKYVMVTRAAHVKKVLAEGALFHVPYTKKMEAITDGSGFFLGYNADDDRFHTDQQNMRQAIVRDDLTKTILPYVSEQSRQIVDQFSKDTDIVSALLYKVPSLLMVRYIGLSKVDSAELASWCTVLFEYLFYEDFEKVQLSDAQQHASSSINRYLDNVIAEKKTEAIPSDPSEQTVLERLIVQQKEGKPRTSDADIRNNLLGILIGAIATTARATTLVMEYLIQNPKILRKARSAASHSDAGLLQSYVHESLRFNGFQPILLRKSVEDYRLDDDYRIKKDREVLAFIGSAMFDKRMVDSPRSFSIDRPRDHYLIYGFGPHECFGKYINDIQITEIVRALLRKDFTPKGSTAYYRNNIPQKLILNFS